MRNISVVIFFFFMACNYPPKFERKNEIVNYIKNEHNIELTGINSLIIIISGGCSSCTEETVKIVKALGKDKNLSNVEKFLIMPKTHLHLISNFTNSGFELLPDENIQVDKYGINFEKNVIIQLSKDLEVDFWQWLYLDKIYDVKKHYNLLI